MSHDYWKLYYRLRSSVAGYHDKFAVSIH